MTGTSKESRGQNVSESESFSVVVPSLEGSLGLRGLLAWRGRDFSRAPGEGAPELQGEEKGIMVARMRARQSATSLLGAQARAGVRPAGKDSQRARETGKGDRKAERGKRRDGAVEEKDRDGEVMDEKRHSISAPLDTQPNTRLGAKGDTHDTVKALNTQPLLWQKPLCH